VEKSFYEMGVKVSIITIIVNVFLAAFKFIAGIAGNSQAMISDAIHSLSDVLSTIIVIIGLKLSSKQADVDHPYGHERLESIAAFILASILFVTGVFIGIEGIKNIINPAIIKKTTIIALIGAIISIVVKEGMYWYTIYYAKKIKSESLKADAWHHRSDALSSIGSLIGIAGSMLGIKVLDSIASIIICLFIVKVAYDIFKDALTKLVDHACSEETILAIERQVLKIEGVENIDLIKTRMFGNKIYIDLEISADKNMTLERAHKIAHDVHDDIENEFPDVKHCMIHVNPK